MNSSRPTKTMTNSAAASAILDANAQISRLEHELQLSTAALARAHDELGLANAVFETQEGIMITNPAGVILRVNQALMNDTGYTEHELIGQTPSLLKSGRHPIEFYAFIWESLANHGIWQGEIWDRRKTGEIYPKWMTINAVKTRDGQLTHYVSTHQDISERKHEEAEFKYLVCYDPLTQLPNRRLLEDRLQQALASTKRSGRLGAVLFIDLDHFKNLNDTRGHQTGDLLLLQVASRLLVTVREGDTVARLGGDEFVIIFKELSNIATEAAAETKILGEKIIAALNVPYLLNGQHYSNTPSIGAVLFDNEGQSVDELLSQSDIAMYQAKEAGRNTLRFFDPQMQNTINARVLLEGELRNALLNKEFELYYQPQVDSDGRTTGAEALIRWNHPERGLILPFQFIASAEENGLILPIGLWVLDTACAQLAAWQKTAPELTLAVNVSARQFHQADFVTLVQNCVKRHRINPARLKLELTESMLVENIENIIQKIRTLKDDGIQFSLDDFGTGYSSLQYLKMLPINQLKIDQSFVRDLFLDGNDRAIVRTIIAMAISMDLNVIAEGVESEVQRQLLINKGCRFFQGYLFGEPVPIKQFHSLMNREA